MPHFGRTSRKRLATCHPDLQVVLKAAILFTDFSILCGQRDKAAQDAAFYGNPQRSSVQWPNSKHNILPSTAVDVAPWWPDSPHIRWKRKNEFILLAGIIIGIGSEMGIQLRWGGNWDQDHEIITDQNLVDLPHLELVDPGRITS